MKNTVLYFSNKIEIEDFATFYLNRFEYMDNSLFIDQYNREVEIGNTGEVLQVCYFTIMDRIFKRKFGKSPMVLNSEDKSITIKGTIYLSKDSFEFENNEYDFSIENSTQRNKDNAGKIILTKERRAFLEKEVAKRMGQDPVFKERVLKMIEEKKLNNNK
ncbi:MAG: hypothetical protein RSC72_15080 [Algoriella sp.]|uniref:hypothetical protein n=1 Tax=Algoriella sp. TaxID=1872434 RepID=UPI002FC8A3E9